MREQKLTINVITYNHKDYLGDCLNSLLSQKTDFDYIIRIFEDCSTDGTQEICKKYKEKHPDKIELYLAKKNLGAAKNAARSYKNIKTPYYMFIEGDDYCCDNNKFQLQVDTLDANPDCSFCACKTKIVQNKRKVGAYPSIKEKKYTKEEVVRENRSIISGIGSRIVRTKCINMDKDKYYLLDSSQAYMLLNQGSMYFIDKIMNTYRVTQKGFWTGKNLKDRFDFVYKNFSKYNIFLNREYEKQIYNHMNIDFSGAYYQTYFMNNNIFRQIRYYLPPVIFVMGDILKYIFRKVKRA